jgi:4-amino-4-deoxy-L-arabinose transferase-like glycosyltransferase
MSPETTIIVIVIVLAVLLDAALIFRLRRNPSGRYALWRNVLRRKMLRRKLFRNIRQRQEPSKDPRQTSAGERFKAFVQRLMSWKIYQPLPVHPAEGTQAKPETEPNPADSLSPVLPAQDAADSDVLAVGQTWLEWGVIILAVYLFCAGFLDLSAATRLPGNESEVFQSLDWTLINSLRHYGQFPLWNPYIRTGIPYVADPMLHIYNPVVTLPVLLFGVRAGFKLAMFFSFVLAALGMWRLARELDFKSPARIWVALMYAFAGQPLAHFFQGQYLFILGFAWIPWIVAGLFLVVRTRRRRYAAMTVFFLGLLFFSGNAYYSFYILLIASIFVLVMLPQFQPHRPYLKIDLKLLAIFATIAVLALGIVAIQLFPEAQFWPWIEKDMKVAGSHTLGQIFLDYTSKDASRPDAFSQLPAREEFYAYIGLAPFLALPLLPLAWRYRKRRPIVFLWLVILLVVAWVTLDQMLWRDVFLELPGLRQFRHLLRILVLGSFALIALAGMGLDQLWRITANPAQARTAGSQPAQPKTAGFLGSSLVIIFMVVSLVDLFQTNGPITRSVGIHQPAYTVMNWLRNYDPSDYYVRHFPNNSWQEATIAANLPYFEVWYHFAELRNHDGQINDRPVDARPKYIVQSSTEPAPAGTDLRLINQMLDTSIYRDMQSLPLIFKLAKTRLDRTAGASPLTPEQVEALSPAEFSPNRIQVVAEGVTNEILVVLVTHYPDWTVKMDGQPVELKKVGGYLAVELGSGKHHYSFSYQPKAFLAGLFVSLLATAATFFLLFSDLHLSRRYIQQRVDQLSAGFGQAWHEFGRAWVRLAGWLKSGISANPQVVEEPLENTADIASAAGEDIRTAADRWMLATGNFLDAIARAISMKVVVWAAILGVYLLTRLVGLTQFPIYFFTDEAAQTILASDLVRDNFKNYAGDFLPAFFENGGYYRLGVSVYVQIIPYLLFGKSIAVTRGTSVFITLLGVIALGLILRNHFRLRYWWSGVLLLSLAPAWFLHSRTAFETAEAVSFFALFIFFYLEYRAGKPRYLYLALVAGALAFYTYSPFQIIMPLCGVFLLLVDWRYHWRNRANLGPGLVLALILAIPYLRFILTRGQANLGTLAALGSVWIRPVPLSEKIVFFAREYLHGLSPTYWFLPQSESLIRHEMKGYAYLPWIYLPLIGAGFIISLRNFYLRTRSIIDERRTAAFRMAWICLLVIPVSSALVQVGITRLLAMVVPAVLFTAVGLDWILSWIGRHRISARILALGVFCIMAGFNFWMLRDALVNGPTWYSDYGMGGLQYGTRQVFPAVREYLQDNPDSRVVISPTWANGTDLLGRFMLPESLPVEMGSITGYMDQHKAIDENTLFVLPPDEYQSALESGKFTGIQVLRTLLYPDGRPGFYFLKLRYVAEIDQILAAERDLRHQLQEDEINLDGQTVTARHSLLDMGSIASLFDQQNNSVTRTLEANPYILELTFPEPRKISGLSVIIGSSEVEITALRYASQDSEPDRQVARLKGSVNRPEVAWEFDQPVDTQLLRLEVKDLHQSEPAHVHLWEIRLR